MDRIYKKVMGSEMSTVIEKDSDFHYGTGVLHTRHG
jgi:hypothetical protein